jgi:hypothetical protein
MKVLFCIFVIVVLGWLIATTNIARAPASQPCTQEWFLYLSENYFEISDGEGHGPDLGSNEWFDAFEAKAKLSDSSQLPDQRRCQLIQGKLEHRTYIINQQLGLTISF